MSTKPLNWKSTTAEFTYDPERGCVYRTIFGQASRWFCGALPLQLQTVEAVKAAIHVKLLAEKL